MNIRTLIVDDESLARARLRLLLEADPEIEIAGECSAGSEALEYLNRHSVDLVVLDIQMPTGTGIEVIQQLRVETPPIFIFVTAHDDYAVEAFELHALDYLLKPVQTKRLQATLARVKERLHVRDVLNTQDQLSSVLKLLQNIPQQRTEYAERFLVKNGSRDDVVNVRDIEWIEAADYYVSLHVSSKEHLLRESIKALELKLDPKKFVRVARSAIINVDFLNEIHRDSRIDGWAVLHNGRRIRMNKAGWKKLSSVSGA
jgi:two-component system, LytTR family, response regulator